MKSNLAPLNLLLAAALSLAPTFVYAQAAGQTRDESLAREFIYCAVVAQYWMEVFSRPEGGNEASARASRQQRDYLYLAAAMKSDGEFLKAERPAAISRVQQKMEEQRAAGNTASMGNEARECMGIFATKAVPLLKR